MRLSRDPFAHVCWHSHVVAGRVEGYTLDDTFPKAKSIYTLQVPVKTCIEESLVFTLPPTAKSKLLPDKLIASLPYFPSLSSHSQCS